MFLSYSNTLSIISVYRYKNSWLYCIFGLEFTVWMFEDVLDLNKFCLCGTESCVLTKWHLVLYTVDYLQFVYSLRNNSFVLRLWQPRTKHMCIVFSTVDCRIACTLYYCFFSNWWHSGDQSISRLKVQRGSEWDRQHKRCQKFQAIKKVPIFASWGSSKCSKHLNEYYTTSM